MLWSQWVFVLLCRQSASSPTSWAWVLLTLWPGRRTAQVHITICSWLSNWEICFRPPLRLVWVFVCQCLILNISLHTFSVTAKKKSHSMGKENICVDSIIYFCYFRSAVVWWRSLRSIVLSTVQEGWRWHMHSQQHAFKLHSSCPKNPVLSTEGSFLSALCTAFISRRLGQCLQDVWVAEAPAEVSFDFVAASAAFTAFISGFVFFKKGTCRSKLVPASHRPGSSCPASCCWSPALCYCHFLSLPGVSREAQGCLRSVSQLELPLTGWCLKNITSL